MHGTHTNVVIVGNVTVVHEDFNTLIGSVLIHVRTWSQRWVMIRERSWAYGLGCTQWRSRDMFLMKQRLDHSPLNCWTVRTKQITWRMAGTVLEMMRHSTLNNAHVRARVWSLSAHAHIYPQQLGSLVCIYNNLMCRRQVLEDDGWE